MKKLKELVMDGDMDGTVERVKLLLEEGKEADVILKEGLIPGIDKAGELFQEGEFYIPELLVAARAMKEGLEILKPLLVDKGTTSLGKIIIGTVKGDRHDIGKTLVVMTLESAGFEIIDLGVDVPPVRFIDAIKEHSPVAIGLSALLTSTMLEMKNVVEAIKQEGLRDNIKILIGGAPVNDAYAKEIGADFYGDDPLSAKRFLIN